MVAYVIKEGIIQAQFVRSSLHSLVGFSSGILYCCSHKLAWYKLAEARERVQLCTCFPLLRLTHSFSWAQMIPAQPQCC